MSQTLNLIRAIGRGPQAPLMYRFLREFGTPMEVVRDKELTGSLPVGHCFKNSYRVAEACGFVYCEGLAVPKKIMPMEHAWVLDQGQFVDPTWSDGTEYVGVAFRTDWLRSHLMKTGVYGVFCNLYALRKSPSWVYDYLKEGPPCLSLKLFNTDGACAPRLRGVICSSQGPRRQRATWAPRTWTMWCYSRWCGTDGVWRSVLSTRRMPQAP